MHLTLLLSTFITVFIAELGDKTQLAIVSISGTTSRPGAVFAGSAFALVLASLLGAAAGGSLSSLIPLNVLQMGACLGFVLLGTHLIRKSILEPSAPGDLTSESPSAPSAEPAGEGDRNATP